MKRALLVGARSFWRSVKASPNFQLCRKCIGRMVRFGQPCIYDPYRHAGAERLRVCMRARWAKSAAQVSADIEGIDHEHVQKNPGRSCRVVPVTTMTSMPASAQQQRPPNILVIMGDDVGWFNIGAYHRGKGA